MSHILVARQDSAGDVLLTGPAIRAISASGARVSMLVSERGEGAARLLPGLVNVIVAEAEWIAPEPEPVSRRRSSALVDDLVSLDVDALVIMTSFHQSPLPLALLGKMAGIPTIAANCVDYPGSLLDVRHRVSDNLHEVERNLSLVAALGFKLPPGDDGALRLRGDVTQSEMRGLEGCVVVHPGASVPARAWSAARLASLVDELGARGESVVVTGSAAERELTTAVAGRSARNLGGALDFGELAAVLARASALVSGNTGPAHLAAAVGCPVVSLYAPTVPAVRWRPYKVPHVLLGNQDIKCAGCRSRVCPLPGHPCLDDVTVDDVMTALATIRRRRAA